MVKMIIRTQVHGQEHPFSGGRTTYHQWGGGLTGARDISEGHGRPDDRAASRVGPRIMVLLSSPTAIEVAVSQVQSLTSTLSTGIEASPASVLRSLGRIFQALKR